MSLDIYLYGDTYAAECICDNCEMKHQVQRQDVIFSANLTHNLTTMAVQCGIYRVLWLPEELGLTKPRQLIPFLEDALTLLRENPDHYKKFNPPNGWGDYNGFLDVVKGYLEACKRHPDAEMRISR